MENLTPQQENNPAARVMSVQEMIEVFQMFLMTNKMVNK